MWPCNIAIALNLEIDTYMQHSVGYISIALLVTVDTLTGADQLLQKPPTVDWPKKQSQPIYQGKKACSTQTGFCEHAGKYHNRTETSEQDV